MSVTPCDRPAEGRDLALELAEVADLRDPRIRLQLVVVDDHRDLAEPAVRRGLERLPELALLELAVAREHVDVAAPPGEAVGQHETARLRDPHPERARVRHHLRRRQDVRVAGQAAQRAKSEELVEREPAEPDQDRVEARRVVALRGEVAVALAEHLELEPRDDVHGAEARADVTRAGVLDHRQRVDSARVREGRDPIRGRDVERADPRELGERDVREHGSSSVQS